MFHGGINPGVGGTGGAFDDELDLLVVAAGVLAFIILAFMAYLTERSWRLKRRLRKVKKYKNDEQVIIYFTGILDIVTYYTTKPLEERETPKAYGLRMGRRFAFQSDSVFFKDLIDLYYKAKYSGDEVTAKEAALMKEAYFDMLALLKAMRRKPIFAYLRYVQGVGEV